jgi:hypothetical protein
MTVLTQITSALRTTEFAERIWCFLCGREGHMSKDCPLGHKEQRAARPAIHRQKDDPPLPIVSVARFSIEDVSHGTRQ